MSTYLSEIVILDTIFFKIISETISRFAILIFYLGKRGKKAYMNLCGPGDKHANQHQEGVDFTVTQEGVTSQWPALLITGFLNSAVQLRMM